MSENDNQGEYSLTLSLPELGFLLLLQMISEVHSRVDPDADASALMGRAREVLGAWESLGRLVIAPGTPFEPKAKAGIADLKALIDRAEPLLSRIAGP